MLFSYNNHKVDPLRQKSTNKCFLLITFDVTSFSQNIKAATDINEDDSERNDDDVFFAGNTHTKACLYSIRSQYKQTSIGPWIRITRSKAAFFEIVTTSRCLFLLSPNTIFASPSFFVERKSLWHSWILREEVTMRRTKRMHTGQNWHRKSSFTYGFDVQVCNRKLIWM